MNKFVVSIFKEPKVWASMITGTFSHLFRMMMFHLFIAGTGIFFLISAFANRDMERFAIIDRQLLWSGIVPLCVGGVVVPFLYLYALYRILNDKDTD
ncbi:MAG: hypothetical protein JXR76_04065 [Deltaproteobacteria bacterium]|nr:hypothetical protein [Deltaproteobacteria bacterium]